ncbi:HXXEE domain-containing protein [Pelomonas sp. BJYL3]|uniref:HXXEE domain-containing protein n=1 Tax=Pelomonas sp. BJYL3 TaxID=2976697 RepID=UPI0022B58672|nr:HXXEE domain-containing protein [Pelomonas sp. BJYL3]
MTRADGLGLAFTAAVLVHNAEEAWLLPRWSRAQSWYRPVGDGEFRWAVLLLSLLLLGLTGLQLAWGSRFAELSAVFSAYVIAMLVNALLPHLALSLLQRRYMPGTASAWLGVVPLGLAWLQAAQAEGRLLLAKHAWTLVLSGLVLALLVPVLLWLGRRLAARRPS